MLKCQFHAHAGPDPEHPLSYTEKELIKEAAHLKYDVLAITCHNKIFHKKSLEQYAKKLGIILFPGIEKEIQGKHVLIINAKKEAEKIETFEQLREYKNSHPNSLIIAPHPFFPGPTLKKSLIENIDIFDAIEHSFAYTTTKNYNSPAIALAHRWRKPLLATADVHFLKHLNLGYTLVDSAKNKTSIIQAIKKNRLKIHHQAISYYEILKSLLIIEFQKYFFLL
ncbi:hypothetical protein KJ632_01820 [Patescibacteria group bacterium]|nr:hypothetical protein [Patescibacteria group bacterium]